MPYYLILVPAGLIMDQLKDLSNNAASAVVSSSPPLPPHDCTMSASGKRDRSRSSSTGDCHRSKRQRVPAEGSDQKGERDPNRPISPSNEMEYLVRMYELKQRHWKHLTSVRDIFQSKVQRCTSRTSEGVGQHGKTAVSSDPAQVKVERFLQNIVRIMGFLDRSQGGIETKGWDLGSLDRVEKHIKEIIMPVVVEINKVKKRKGRKKQKPRQRQGSQSESLQLQPLSPPPDDFLHDFDFVN